MSDTRIRASLATDVLKDDHRRVRKLFEDYERLGDDDERYELFSRIQRELTRHAAIEDEIFYPAVEAVGNGKELVEEAREEHRRVKMTLEELAGLIPSFEAFHATMRVLRGDVELHAEAEEDEMFPLFDTLGRDEQESVSEKLAARKRDLSLEAPETPDE
ncbi:MAG TPA: hemerythrin domain-containing protein [Planctomycetota bacterium]